MKKGKEAMLTDYMEGFQEKKTNYNNYEVSFRHFVLTLTLFMRSLGPFVYST